MSDSAKGGAPRPTTQAHDMVIAGPKPKHEEPNVQPENIGLKLAGMAPNDRVQALEELLASERMAAGLTRDMPDFEAKADLHNQLDAAYRELHELLRENEKDDHRIRNSERRWESEKLRCKALGIDFDPEAFGLQLYKGDAALKKRLHKQGYKIAAIEKQLGIRQPEARPLKLVAG